MKGVKFQKFSENGKTHWRFRYTDPVTRQQYGWEICKGTVQVAKNPKFYNDQRWCVAQQILMIRHKFRILRQKLANA